MNSKGHLYISIAKSIVRILSCIVAIMLCNAIPLAIGFLAAEILGIVEELVDKR